MRQYPAHRRSDDWAAVARSSGPGRPTVVRNRVTTRIFAAAAIRSCTRISLLTAAAISGVRPEASAASRSGCRLVGEQPVAQLADRERAHRRKGFRIVRIDNQPRYFIVSRRRTTCSVKKMRKRHIGQGKLRRHALFCGRGSNPASSSPLRNGVALASNSRRLPNV